MTEPLPDSLASPQRRCGAAEDCAAGQLGLAPSPEYMRLLASRQLQLVALCLLVALPALAGTLWRAVAPSPQGEHLERSRSVDWKQLEGRGQRGRRLGASLRRVTPGATQTGPRVAVCAIIREEPQPDLDEWILHYERLGAAAVLLFDHGNDSASTRAALAPHIRRGFVLHHPWQGPQQRFLQADAYNACLALYRHAFSFLAFVDADEFVALRDPAVSLPELLANFTAFGGLALNWQTFGPSGHDIRPAGGLLASYDRCLPAWHPIEEHVKLIVNTQKVLSIGGPHTATFWGEDSAVNSQGLKVEGPWSRPAVHEAIWLAHYGTRSRQDYRTHKVERGGANGAGKGWSYWELLQNEANQTCPMLRDRARLKPVRQQ